MVEVRADSSTKQGAIGRILGERKKDVKGRFARKGKSRKNNRPASTKGSRGQIGENGGEKNDKRALAQDRKTAKWCRNISAKIWEKTNWGPKRDAALPPFPARFRRRQIRPQGGPKRRPAHLEKKEPRKGNKGSLKSLKKKPKRVTTSS